MSFRVSRSNPSFCKLDSRHRFKHLEAWPNLLGCKVPPTCPNLRTVLQKIPSDSAVSLVSSYCPYCYDKNAWQKKLKEEGREGFFELTV